MSKRPIVSHLKSQMIHSHADDNPIGVAYLRETRERNKTRRIYDIDPYAEVYQFRDNMYGLYTDSADGAGPSWMYLIIGPEKAMLIDTSFGIGDLRGLCNLLTGNMPLIVANTHSAYDHSYGNCQFDEVYCHEYAIPRMLRQHNPHIWDYLFNEDGSNKWLQFDRKDIVEFRDYTIKPVKNGHIFNLGQDYDIELIWMPGHQPGHSMYLDKKNRLIIGGDATCCESIGIGGGPKPGVPGDPYVKYGTVRAFRDELRKLVKRKHEFDRVFPGHAIVDLDAEIFDRILETAEHIVRTNGQADFIIERNGFVTKQNFIKGFGQLKYRDATIGNQYDWEDA